MTSLLSWSVSVIGNGWVLGAILVASNLALGRLPGIPARVRYLIVWFSLLALPVLSMAAGFGRGDVRVIASPDETMPWIVLLVWWTGSTLLALRELGGHRRLRRMRASWREATDAERRHAGVAGEIPLHVGEIGRPVTVGSFLPAICLPRRAFEDLEPDALRAVARHESAHVRWRDPLLWAVARLVRISFWPIVPLWILERLAYRESEAAADAAAVRGADAGQRRGFGAALLTVSTWDAGLEIGGSSAGFTGGALTRRIEALVEPWGGGRRGWVALAALGALTLLALAAAPRMRPGLAGGDDVPSIHRLVIVEGQIVRGG